MRNKARIRFLLGVLALLHGIVIFAGFFAPYDSKQQNRDLPYAPPTKLHFSNLSGLRLRPFFYGWVQDVDGYHEDRTHEYRVRFFVRGDSYSVLGIGSSSLHFFGGDSPERIMLLGADAFGRDEFSRLLFGGQISLSAGLIATLIALTTAAFIGTLSGFYGGWIDEALMGVSELFLCLPWLYFLLGVRA